MEFNKLAEHSIADGSIDDAFNVLRSAIDLTAKKYPEEFLKRRSEIAELLLVKLPGMKETVPPTVDDGKEPAAGKNQRPRRVIKIKMRKTDQEANSKQKPNGANINIDEDIPKVDDQESKVGASTTKPKRMNEISTRDVVGLQNTNILSKEKRKIENTFTGVKHGIIPRKVRVNLGGMAGRIAIC